MLTAGTSRITAAFQVTNTRGENAPILVVVRMQVHSIVLCVRDASPSTAGLKVMSKWLVGSCRSVTKRDLLGPIHIPMARNQRWQ